MRSSSHSRSTARARRSSPIGAPTARCVASSSGTPSTRPSPVTRRRGRCASSTTMPAAGASTTRRTTGRRSGTVARRTTVRRSCTSSRVARRPTEPTGPSSRGNDSSRCSASIPGCPSRRPTSSTSRTGAASSPKIEVYTHWTYGGQWQGVFGRFTYLGQPIFGFGSTAEGNPQGPLRAERLHRHVQFGLRAGLEA